MEESPPQGELAQRLKGNMNATVFTEDSKSALIGVRPHALSDGSTVWNMHFYRQEEIAFASEKAADEAMELIVEALRKSMGNVEVF